MNRTGITSLIGSERPGYRRCSEVYKKKMEERKDFENKRAFFLRQNEDGEDITKKGGNLKHRIMQYNEEKDEFEFVDNSFYDPSKIRKQEQVIILPDGSYINIFNEEQGGLNQLPNFMLYSDAQNMDRAKLMDKVNTVKDTASFIGKIAAGKPFKDDVGFLDAAKEYAKATGRTFLGGAKVAPEALAAGYRFLMPSEKLGGVGPIDTFTGDRTHAEDFYLPGYSDLFGKDKAGQGVFPKFLMPDSSLYAEDDEFDELLQEAMGFDRDEVNEQAGAMLLGTIGPGITALSGPVRSAAHLAKMKKLENAINKSKTLRTMDNPIAQIGAGVTGDLAQDYAYDE